MAPNLPSYNYADEDYIDMEVSPSANFLCYSINSPPQSREFEFQMSSISHGREFISPADELFYKGKLLPLHLPPRLQMVQKLLHNSNAAAFEDKEEAFDEEFFTIPFMASTIKPPTNTSTPLESCISPSESRRVSNELNPDAYFFEWSSDVSGSVHELPKKSWLMKFKQSSLGQKFNASRTYLKSLFSKSGCSDESCAKAACNEQACNVSKGKQCLSKYMKIAKKTPFEQIENERYQMSPTVMKSIDKEMVDDGVNSHRRSFSGAIGRHSPTKCSSSSFSSSGSSSCSSFSFNSNGFYDSQLLKRCSSANAEIEISIEGAIAYCKQSQQLFSLRETVAEVGFYSLSGSRFAVCEDQERPALCSIWTNVRDY